MEITWHGLSCFRLTERRKSTVVTDPYDSAAVGLSPLKVRADIVSVSHDAPGHNAIGAVKGYNRLLTGPGEYEIGEVFITAVAVRAKPRAKESIRNTIFVFDYDGVTIAHLGDLARMLTQVEVDALGTVDVALVPVGGGEALNASKAAEVISMLDPGIVIPMHYRTDGINLKLDPLSKFIKEMGLGTIQPEPSLKLVKSSIPEETRVVVLEQTQ
jgi:L-ascorbate metabolism protein UlaG (beta-lactamase superfamily)